tara:strand:- start:214 stop:432 length:219 start_codon:yes stop_codon:yes gene_type:complete
MKRKLKTVTQVHEEAIANAIGGGAVAGGGYNATPEDDDVKVTKKKKKGYKEKNAAEAPSFRRIAGIGIGDGT